MLDETSHAFEIIRSVSRMSIMIIFVYSIDIENKNAVKYNVSNTLRTTPIGQIGKNPETKVLLNK